MSRLETHYSMRQFQPKKHHLLDKENVIKEQFQIGAVPPLLAVIDLAPQDQGTWLEPARINKLRADTESFASLPHVLSSTSIANVTGASSTKDGVTVGVLLAETDPILWNQRVLNDPLLTPQLISKDARSVLISIEREDMSNTDILATTEKIRKQLEQSFPGAIVQLGGVPTMQSQMANLLQGELLTLSLLSLAAMALTLALIFRNISAILITLYVTVLANVAVLAWMALAKITFSILSTTLPILISVNAVSMVAYTLIHFSTIWRDSSFEESEKLRAIAKTFRELFIPNALASLTTCVGFAALMTSHAPMVIQYGQVVAIAVVVAWAAGTFALPLCMVLAPAPKPRQWTLMGAAWTQPVVVYAKPIFYGICVLSVISAVVGSKQRWSNNLFQAMPQGLEARSITERIDAKMGGMIPLDVTIAFKKADAWNDPGRIARTDALLQRWRNFPEVGSAIGLPDFLRAANLTKSGQLPKTRKAIGELVFLYSISDARPLDSFLTNEGRDARIAIRIHDMDGPAMAKVVSRVERETKKMFPGAKVQVSNMATTVHVLNYELSSDLVFGFWQALAFIGALLLVVYRSWRWTLVAILPNFVAPVLLLGVMSVVGTPIEPGIAIIFSIALGLAFNNTVYVLGRLRLLYNHPGQELPVAKALYLEGMPCVLATLPLFTGFAVFLGSNFQLNQTFGSYMLVAIAAGCLGDLVLLPTMLQLFPKMLRPVGFSRKHRGLEEADIIPAHALAFQETGLVQNLVEAEPTTEEEESEMSTAIAASIAIFVTLASQLIGIETAQANTGAAPSAQEILDRVSKNLSAKDEAATVQMRIIEKNGSKKDRELKIERKSTGAKKNVLVRLLAPGDIRGTGLLSVEENHRKDQWLFLPSSKKSRRILGQGQGGSFLGSELSYEDMGGSQGVEFASKVLRMEGSGATQTAVVESVPQKGESAYSKIISWVPLDKNVVSKVEYYDAKGKLLKVALFANYKKYGSNTWRATKMQVKNVQTQRSTILVLRGLEVNRGIQDDVFSVANLEELE